MMPSSHNVGGGWGDGQLTVQTHVPYQSWKWIFGPEAFDEYGVNCCGDESCQPISKKSVTSYNH